MKFNLRDLFWLTFVAAVATMWWIDRSKLADRLRVYETVPATPAGPILIDPYGKEPNESPDEPSDPSK